MLWPKLPFQLLSVKLSIHCQLFFSPLQILFCEYCLDWEGVEEVTMGFKMLLSGSSGSLLQGWTEAYEALFSAHIWTECSQRRLQDNARNLAF